MKVLVLGSGGREHAIVKLTMRSTARPRVYVAMDYRNPGLERDSVNSGGRAYVVNTVDANSIAKVAEEVAPDLIVVGPEEPQFAGVSDLLRDRGFTVFGASSRCAEVERSKAFARMLMWKYEIPGRLNFKAFRSIEEARKFIEFAGDVVVKPARQAGGKGVKVLRDTQAYLSRDRAAVKRTYVEKLYTEMERYRDIDYKILVEQRVEGVEYTVQVVTDGSYVLPLPAVQDHPHAYSYDIGPETGGMGSILGPGVVLPFLTIDEYKKSVEIVKQVLDALSKEVGESFIGAFAGQMMLTGLWGPTVIEFYSRFGDPEISNLIPVITSDFLEVLERAAVGKLAGAGLNIEMDMVSVVKAVAPAGYPDDRAAASNHRVAVDEASIRKVGCEVLYASIELRSDGVLYTKGSRIVEIVCGGRDYEDAYRKAERAVQYVEILDGWPQFYRSDIGSPELVRERCRVAERMRRVYTSRAKRGMLGQMLVWVPGEGVFENPLTGFVGVSKP